MNYKNLLPTFSELYSQIDFPHFTQDEIDTQKEIALRLGFPSWEDYLKFHLDIYYRILDIHTVKGDLEKDFPITKKLTGSIPLILNKHKNNSLLQELSLFDKKLSAFTDIAQANYKSFQDKINNLITLLIGQKLSSSELELLAAFSKDVEIQFSSINKNNESNNSKVISIEDSFLLSETNNAIKNLYFPNYYFPAITSKLKALQEGLVELEYMERNEDFVKTFETREKSRNLKPTLWLVDSTKLFYLLYRLNSKKEYYNDLSIDKIANQLFTFKNDKTPNSIRTSFGKALPKFGEDDYLEKKMSNLLGLLNSLFI
ncbi:MAG: hypothetical protein H0X62_12670 [Bacteroidetes bacterium]|nr:hypothetical protein [Bacteroidota bacterium]